MTNQDKERRDGIIIVALVGLLAAGLWLGRRPSATPAPPVTPQASPTVPSTQPITIRVMFSQF